MFKKILPVLFLFLTFCTPVIPSRYKIDNVPYVQQIGNTCGSAALTSVMNYYKYNVSLQEVSLALSPGIKEDLGTSSPKYMEIFSKEKGFEFVFFKDYTKNCIKYYISKGFPVIIFGKICEGWYDNYWPLRVVHFLVIIGYDEKKELFIVKDPNMGDKEIIVSYEILKKFNIHDNYSKTVIVIFPKGEKSGSK